MPLYKLGYTRKVLPGSPLYKAYFAQDNHEDIEVAFTRPFGRGQYTAHFRAFEHNGKLYAVRSFEHYNAHFTSFRDPSNILSINVALASVALSPFSI